MKYLLILSSILIISCGQTASTVQGVIDSFEIAVNANNTVSLKAYIWSSSQDYSLLDAGLFFEQSGSGLWDDYYYDYTTCTITENTSTASAACAVAVTDLDNLPIGFDVTATLSFQKVDTTWYLSRVDQVKVNGGDEENLLKKLKEENLNKAAIKFLTYLKENNGITLH